MALLERGGAASPPVAPRRSGDSGDGGGGGGGSGDGDGWGPSDGEDGTGGWAAGGGGGRRPTAAAWREVLHERDALRLENADLRAQLEQAMLLIAGGGGGVCGGGFGGGAGGGSGGTGDSLAGAEEGRSSSGLCGPGGPGVPGVPGGAAPPARPKVGPVALQAALGPPVVVGKSARAAASRAAAGHRGTPPPLGLPAGAQGAPPEGRLVQRLDDAQSLDRDLNGTLPSSPL